MYRYEPFQMKHSLSHSSYGILGKEEQDGIWITVAVAAAFSDNREAVSRLAETCTRLSLSPEQLLDVVADFIVTAVEKKQMLLFNPGAHRRPRGRETA